MAEHGLNTSAWDISDIALQSLTNIASQQKLNINSLQRDIVLNPPEPNSFDVIIVSRFLDRKIIPALITALRRDGLTFYQTFIKDKVNDNGPKNPEYRLDKNELLHLFEDLQLTMYREEGSIGNIEEGFVIRPC